MSERYSRAQIEQMLHAKVKKLSVDFTGNVVVSKYKDEKIFKFAAEETDVTFFREKFRELKNHGDVNYIWYQIRGCVEEKLDEYERRGTVGNILEAYLYALKLEDGCFGTVNHSGNVSQELIEAYEKAVAHIYNRKEYREMFYEVMKHTLVNWESYQPLLLVISFFADYPKCGDEEIDEIMRSHLLYRKIFAKTTFKALCERAKKENFEEFLKFIAVYNNKDKVTETMFTPDNAMTDMFINTLRLPENQELYDYLKVIYQTRYKNRNANKAIRVRLDRFFEVPVIEKSQDTDWPVLFQSFKNYNETAREKVVRDMRFKFSLGKSESRELLSYIEDKELMDVAAEKIADANFSNRCWSLIAVGKNKHGAAKTYLREVAEKYGKGEKEEFAYKVACFIQNDRPGLEELCAEYFFDENLDMESQMAPMLKFAVGCKRKSDVFNPYLKKLLEAAVKDAQETDGMSESEKQKCKSSSDLLLRRCKWYFTNGRTIERMYPGAAMRAFLKIKLEQAFAENDRGRISDVLAIIKYAATNISGRQYENMLLEVIHNVDENSAQFTTAKTILQEIAGT